MSSFEEPVFSLPYFYQTLTRIDHAPMPPILVRGESKWQKMADEIAEKLRLMAEQVPNGGPAVEEYCRYCKHRRKHKCRLHKCRIKNAICNQFAEISRQKERNNA